MNYVELFEKIRSEFSSNIESVPAKNISEFLKNSEKVGTELTQKEINKVFNELRKQQRNEGQRGKFNMSENFIPTVYKNVPPPEETILDEKDVKHSADEIAENQLTTYIPKKDKSYVPHGCYNTVYKVIESRKFAPIYIQGESGNGKTFGVEQACANLGRELIIINISNDTTEEDLIGSYVLETINSFEIDISEKDYEDYLKWKAKQKAA